MHKPVGISIRMSKIDDLIHHIHFANVVTKKSNESDLEKAKPKPKEKKKNKLFI